LDRVFPTPHQLVVGGAEGVGVGMGIIREMVILVVQVFPTRSKKLTVSVVLAG
jgi:hypothetical protein